MDVTILEPLAEQHRVSDMKKKAAISAVNAKYQLLPTPISLETAKRLPLAALINHGLKTGGKTHTPESLKAKERETAAKTLREIRSADIDYQARKTLRKAEHLLDYVSGAKGQPPTGLPPHVITAATQLRLASDAASVNPSSTVSQCRKALERAESFLDNEVAARKEQLMATARCALYSQQVKYWKRCAAAADSAVDQDRYSSRQAWSEKHANSWKHIYRTRFGGSK